MAIVFGFIVGLFVTMVLIPPLVRLSDKFGILDQPGPRKVHAVPIPRVGGIAVFFGTSLALVIWAPLDRAMLAFLLGGGVIVLFGAIDDRYALDFKWKLAGQAAAAFLLILGGVRFESLPFCGLDPVSVWFSYPISFLFIIGVTNALNLADGLDGLAAGSAFLSIAGIGFLAFSAADLPLAVAATAVMGAVLGFLRFNTHPAVAFLGDSGSQFLGFSLAAFSLLLITDVNSALNPVLPLLLVGIPLLDTLAVIVLRLKDRRSPFKADNRHIHHRLLAMGLRHYEVVATIYAFQAAMVALAVVMRYQSDALVAMVLLGLSATVFGTLYAAEAKAWRIHLVPEGGHPAGSAPSSMGRRNPFLRQYAWLPTASAQFVQWGVAAFLLAGAIFVIRPPQDIAVVALGVVAVMVLAHFFLHPWTRLFTRVGVYTLCLFVVFLLEPMTGASATLKWTVNLFLLFLCCVLALAVRLTRQETFRMTPQDLLMVLVFLLVPNLPFEVLSDYSIGSMVLRAGVVFYCCEYVLSRDNLSFRSLRVAGLLSLGVLGIRGLL